MITVIVMLSNMNINSVRCQHCTETKDTGYAPVTYATEPVRLNSLTGALEVADRWKAEERGGSFKCAMQRGTNRSDFRDTECSSECFTLWHDGQTDATRLKGSDSCFFDMDRASVPWRSYHCTALHCGE